MAGLLFTVGGANKVAIPASTDLDSLSVLTVMVWADVLNVTTTSQDYVGKGLPSGANGGFILRCRDTANGDLRLSCGLATTNLNVLSPTGALKVNRLQCFGGQYSVGGASTDQKLFIGDTTTPAAEPASYTSQTAGVGIRDDDSATALGLGNVSAVGTVNAPGARLYAVGLWNRLLRLDEVRTWQGDILAPIPGRLALWRPGRDGAGSVRDESGNNHHGTITGAIPTSDVLPRYLG